MDANFWPTEDACLVVADLRNIQGTYRCRFNGQAQKIGFVYGTLGTIGKPEYDLASNTTTFDMVLTQDVPAFSMYFQGTRYDANTNGIKNLQMMRPLTVGSTQSYPFGTLLTDQVKALVAPFTVIRFMDYLCTNSNPLQNWSDRSLPTDASQNPAFRTLVPPTVGGNYMAAPVGGCYEHAIDLCNETQKDMWLDVPLFASDDYVSRLANLVKSRLNANLNVYVEYSNEIWNTAPAFAQGNQNHNLAIADQANGVTPALNPDGDTNDWYWAWRRVARRSVEISDQFRTVFGDAAMPGNGNTAPRIRPVLAWQQGGGATTGLMFIDRNYPHPPSYYLYGTGGSAYYNPDNNSDALTVDNIWTSLSMDYSKRLLGDVALKMGPVCKAESIMAHAFGLKRIAYEGGPSFDTTGHSDAVKNAAWGDSRMQQNIVDHVNLAWSAADGDLLVFYATTSDYCWGFTKNAFQLNTPKYAAIHQLNSQAKAPVTIGNVVTATEPLVVNGIAYDMMMNEGMHVYGNSSFVCDVNPGATVPLQYVGYTFRILSPGNCTVNPSLGKLTAPVQVFCDGVLVATLPVGSTGPMAMPIPLANLQAGLHVIVLKIAKGSIEIKSVAIGVSH